MIFRHAESRPISMQVPPYVFSCSVNIKESQEEVRSCMLKAQRYPSFDFWTFSQAIKSFYSSS
jgi:hypothetical protein